MWQTYPLANGSINMFALKSKGCPDGWCLAYHTNKMSCRLSVIGQISTPNNFVKQCSIRPRGLGGGVSKCGLFRLSGSNHPPWPVSHHPPWNPHIFRIVCRRAGCEISPVFQYGHGYRHPYHLLISNVDDVGQRTDRLLEICPLFVTHCEIQENQA